MYLYDSLCIFMSPLLLQKQMSWGSNGKDFSLWKSALTVSIGRQGTKRGAKNSRLRKWKKSSRKPYKQKDLRHFSTVLIAMLFAATRYHDFTLPWRFALQRFESSGVRISDERVTPCITGPDSCTEWSVDLGDAGPNSRMFEQGYRQWSKRIDKNRLTRLTNFVCLIVVWTDCLTMCANSCIAHPAEVQVSSSTFDVPVG